MMTAFFALPVPGIDPVPDPAREGLPFWLFWLLLSIILLLVFFIFLRNKDLRLRLSWFLAGPKRRMLHLRLQAKIKKERGKKTGLWKDLGQAAWEGNIRAEGTAEVFRSLKALEDELNSAQMAWHGIYTKIDNLEKAGIGAGPVPQETEEARSAEIRDLNLQKEGVQERIVKIKKASEIHYESLGKLLDQTRFERVELALFYFQLDRADKVIRDLQAKIEGLQ
jgi:hypothetical protein